MRPTVVQTRVLRWNHPVLGAVRPDEFIPIAEQSGQIVPLGRWVLRRAAEIAVTHNRDRATPLHISVNVSTRQFTLDDVGDAVRDALHTTGCDPRWLVVELTESLLLEDVPLVHRSLDSLRALGVAIAIDDFGTGYSALHYLTRMRVDHMKIDKSFLRDADVDHQQQEIVRALMAMGNALGIEVVAEGIETTGQARLLEQLGCRLGQGYLLARPMPADQFAGWLVDAPTSLRDALPRLIVEQDARGQHDEAPRTPHDVVDQRRIGRRGDSQQHRSSSTRRSPRGDVRRLRPALHAQRPAACRRSSRRPAVRCELASYAEPDAALVVATLGRDAGPVQASIGVDEQHRAGRGFEAAPFARRRGVAPAPACE